MKKERFKINLILMFLCIILVSFNNISKANNDIKIADESDYSYEYKKWLALPEEEQHNSIMPYMYTINIEDYYNKDSESNINAMANEESLPSSYNTASNLKIKVRNQGDANSCWAISATEMFEILYAKNKNLNSIVNFSDRHVDYSCSNIFLNNKIDKIRFNRAGGSGGNYEYAMAYYTSGNGPILEDNMPFENNKDTINISQIQNKTIQAQLEDYIQYPNIHKIYDEFNNVAYSNGEKNSDKLVIYTKGQMDMFRNMIKKQIIQYGAVGSYTYYKNTDSFFSEENGYIYGDSYFYNNSSVDEKGNPIKINHAICIVGWDDGYSKTNFKEGCQPANNGAYIVLNSWGTGWNPGKGYYYISYDDYFIEQMMFGLQSFSDIDYDNIYQYDELGENYFISTSDNIYGANIFKRDTNSRESLSEIGLYIASGNTDVTIYLNNNSEDLNITNLPVIATAHELSVGYHVLKLEEPILIGKTFSIIVKYSNSTVTLPMEANLRSLGINNSKYNTAQSHPNESFISNDGINWDDLYGFSILRNNEEVIIRNANVCIKAFTINETKKADDSQYILNKNWRTIEISNNTILYGIEEKTTIQELLSSSNFSTDYIVKAYQNDNEVTQGYITTATLIKIFNGNTELQQYSIVIYGDTSGDGNIAAIDALTIIKNKLGTEKFKNEIFEEAGKVTSNTRTINLQPSAVDALAIVKHKLDIEKISQY